MTISIKVTNEDSREDAIVKVSKLQRCSKTLLPAVVAVKELKGCESCVEYVHDGQSLIVEEVQNG